MRTKLLCFILIIITIMSFLSIDVYGENKTYYSVQVGAYEQTINAENMYQRLRKLGFIPYMKSNKNGTIVRVGMFDSKNTAQSILNQLKNLDISGFIVAEIEYENDNTSVESNNTNININDTSSKYLVKNYKFVSDIKVEGVFQSYNHYFNTSNNWKIEDESYLNLVFSRTDIETYKNSTLSILINGYPVYSTLIQDKEKMKASVQVKLPKDKIVNGFNEITFKTYHRITDEPCEDVVNPGNWLIFNKESYVHIEYTKVIDGTKLNDFPYPYIQNEESRPINATIFTPDIIKNKSLKPIVLMTALLGKNAPSNQFGVDILQIKDLEYGTDKNGIFIGSINELPSNWISYFTKDEKEISIKNAIIKEVIAPYNKDQKLLFIVSDNSESLSKAIQALEDPRLVLQMNNSTQVIQQDIELTINEYKDSNYFTFKELGYSSILFEGVLYQKGTIGIVLPENWKVNEEAKIHLNMRYSEVINFDRSGLTIYLNGVPISSKKLSFENANKDVVDIQIPKDLLDSNYYQLEIMFYFELNDRDCFFTREKSSWGYIVNDSYFYLPHKGEKDKILDFYRNPFVIDKSFNDLLFVIPDSDNSDKSLKIIGNMITYMAQNVQNIDNIDIIKASELNKEYKNYNIVVVGTPQENKVIQDWNQYLHVQLNGTYSRFESNEKMKLLEGYNKDLASIQLITSPLNPERNAMIVTSTTSTGLDWADKYLTEAGLVQRLAGNAVLIDEVGNILYEYYGIELEKEQTDILEESKNFFENITTVNKWDDIKRFIIWFASIVIVIILVLFILLRRNKRRKI